jgi:hypothetical protein
MASDINVIKGYLIGAGVDLDKCFVAGGYVRDVDRGVAPKDMDLFFERSEDIEKFANFLDKIVPKSSVPTFGVITSERYSTEFAYTYSNLPAIDLPVQLIRRTGTPDEVLSTFDFTINQCYKRFDQNLPTRKGSGRLLKVIDKSRTKHTLLSRMFKFINDGYDIELEELKKVMKLTIEGIEENFPDRVYLKAKHISKSKSGEAF